jgi:uridine kinase
MRNCTVAFSDGTTEKVPKNTSLLELAAARAAPGRPRIIAALLDNAPADLNEKITRDCALRFFGTDSPEGMRVYERSLVFLLAKATRDLYPDKKVLIRHSVRLGLYFDMSGGTELLPEELAAIEKRMRELTARSIPFERREVDIAEAEKLFEIGGRKDLYNAIVERHKPYVVLYGFDGMTDYSYGHLAPHSGFVDSYSLLYHYPGCIITYPKKTRSPLHASKLSMYHDMPKLLSVFSEYRSWGGILGIGNIGEFNRAVRHGGAPDIIRVAEALQEKKISQIADAIAKSPERRKLVLISGPSSSGKTTFANRLSIQLRVNGFTTHTVSMDDYYLNRADAPVGADGAYNFECPEALDIDLFSSQMNALIGGQPVSVPVYNFKRGAREGFTRQLRVGDSQIVIVEGIHGLNPKITAQIPRERKYKIYISALTSLGIDDHNRIPTTDARLIRRITRDHQFRASSALDTIRIWPSVRAGEEEYIFPYQESCDVMFNSGLIYELGAMKDCVIPLLEGIGPGEPEYPEAMRLVKFMSYFAPIKADDIPPNSILREFLGGSCFAV